MRRRLLTEMRFKFVYFKAQVGVTTTPHNTYKIYIVVLLSMKERIFFFDRLVLEKFFDGKLWFHKDFPKL